MYIYQADVYCDTCGAEIRLALKDRSPENRDDETSYDSNEYPKGPYPEDQESDCPQHCGSHEKCLDDED